VSARLVRWALGGALILAAAGCGPAQMTAGNGGAHIPSSLAPSTLGAPSGGVTEIYAIPAAVPQYDGTLFAHTAGTAYASDQPLGAGTGGFVVPAVAPNDAASPIAQWFDSTTDQVMFANPGASVVSFGQKSSGPTAVPISGVTYFFFAPLFIPLLILGVPLVDMAFAFVRRTARGTGFDTPDKEHIHHRLLRLGHGPRRSVIILWAWTAVLSSFLLFPLFVHQVNAFIPIGAAALGVGLYTFFHPGLRRGNGEDEDERQDQGQLPPPGGARRVSEVVRFPS